MLFLLSLLFADRLTWILSYLYLRLVVIVLRVSDVEQLARWLSLGLIIWGHHTKICITHLIKMLLYSLSMQLWINFSISDNHFSHLNSICIFCGRFSHLWSFINWFLIVKLVAQGLKLDFVLQAHILGLLDTLITNSSYLTTQYIAELVQSDAI